MKTKPLLIAVCLLAFFAGIASWFSSRGEAEVDSAKRSAGESVLPAELLQSAREIHLLGQAEEEKVTLRKDDGSWRLPDYYGLPADFEKLSRFTSTLLDAEISRFVTSTPERLERLDLGRRSVRLLGENGQAWTLEIGDSGSAGGNFVRFDEEPAAYLTTASIFVDTRPDNWPLKRPLSFEERDVARVEFTVDGESLVFVRDEPGAAFRGDGLDQNESAKSSAVSRMVRSLVAARFTEAVAPDHDDAVAARAHEVPVVLELFEGDRYTLKIGRRPGTAKERSNEAGIEKKETSTSIVIDQDGNFVSPELIAEKEAEAAASATEEIEEVEPGPVFVSYGSENPDFVWAELRDRVALKFPDSLFNQVPDSREALIEVTPIDETAEDDEEPETTD